MYQLSPKRLETWKGEWRAKGELAFPGKSARPQSRLEAERIAELERNIGQQAMELDFLKKALRHFREQPLPVVANGDASSIRKSGKRSKRGAAVNRLCRAAGVSRAGYYRFRRRAQPQPT
jgi:transposase